MNTEGSVEQTIRAVESAAAAWRDNPTARARYASSLLQRRGIPELLASLSPDAGVGEFVLTVESRGPSDLDVEALGLLATLLEDHQLALGHHVQVDL